MTTPETEPSRDERDLQISDCTVPRGQYIYIDEHGAIRAISLLSGSADGGLMHGYQGGTPAEPRRLGDQGRWWLLQLGVPGKG